MEVWRDASACLAVFFVIEFIDRKVQLDPILNSVIGRHKSRCHTPNNAPLRAKKTIFFLAYPAKGKCKMNAQAQNRLRGFHMARKQKADLEKDMVNLEAMIQREDLRSKKQGNSNSSPNGTMQ